MLHRASKILLAAEYYIAKAFNNRSFETFFDVNKIKTLIQIFIKQYLTKFIEG
jgi:hypothetical protein